VVNRTFAAQYLGDNPVGLHLTLRNMVQPDWEVIGVVDDMRLDRTGRNRMPRAPRRPVQRYEKSRPGELLHLDLKYLPALDTWPEFEYAAIDDFTREGHALIARERSTMAAARFLEHVLAQLPYRVEAVMTDNDMMFNVLCLSFDSPDAVRTGLEERRD